MTDVIQFSGIGVEDLQMAASREVQRIMREAHGDRRAAVKLVLEKLYRLDLISENDLKSLSKVCDIGFDSVMDKIPPEQAYAEVRWIYDGMLAGCQASPTALAIASAATGSYINVDVVDGQPTVVFSKKGSWQDQLTAAGAVIGAVIGGGAQGAAIGAAIGGVAGRIVDECTD